MLHVNDKNVYKYNSDATSICIQDLIKYIDTIY